MHQQPEESTNNEVVVYRQDESISSDSVHYLEILESESSAEEPTSGEGVEEATSEYENLDAVAVAERRLQPPTV